MSSKYFPGLPPYVDPGFEARGIPDDVRGGLRSSWPTRRVEDQLAALATIDAIPGDQAASLQQCFDIAATLIVGQAVSLEGQVEAATLLGSAYGLDVTALSTVGTIMAPAAGDGEGGASSPGNRDLYIAKAKELEAKIDEAAKAWEAAEKRATLAEKALSTARTDLAVYSNQIANLRMVLATKDADAARVKAGFEKALAEAKDQLAEASKPVAPSPAIVVPSADAPLPTITIPPAIEAPAEVTEVVAPSPADTPPTDDADARSGKPGRKAR